MRRRWAVGEVERDQAESLASALGIAPPVARLLVQRGYSEPAAAERFLHPSASDFHDPRLLPDVDRAVSRILKALDGGERVTVFGDYDADGVTSAALLGRVLKRLARNPDLVSVRVPHRHVNGYGLSADTVRQLQQEEQPSVLVTADCGVSAFEGADCARELGIDLIVTDHHEPGDTLPNALAVVNPKRADSAYPFRELAGVGVAYKLGEALAMARGIQPQTFAQRFLDLVALGTVADSAPLVDENRALVSLGLAQLPGSRKPGIRALLEASGLRGPVRAGAITYTVAPRLNAVGRVDDAAKALDLLMTQDSASAADLVRTLERLNDERRETQERIWHEAQAIIHKRQLVGDLVLLVAGENWPKGIIGIVAGRLAELYHRPALVAAVEGDAARGSARSAADFPMIDALRSCRELLGEFGGHSQAAGFDVPVENLEALRERLNVFARQAGLDEEKVQPCLDVDLEVEAHEINAQTLKDLTRLEPFGAGNREPVFTVRDLTVISAHAFGKQADKPHLSLKVNGEGLGSTDCILWRKGPQERHFPPGLRMDVAFRLEPGYLNTGTVRLNVLETRIVAEQVDPAFQESPAETYG